MKFKKKIPIIILLAFTFLLLFMPSVGRIGAKSGILLCGNVVIPSLFPFCVCSLYLLKANLGDVFKKIFPQKGEIIFVFFLSMLGGYPIGAKLVRELNEKGILDCQNARKLILCSVNAGPAFIVIAVGSGILSSKLLGYILLISHLLSSVIMAFFIIPFLQINPVSKIKKAQDDPSPFVTAVGEAAGSMVSVCAFVIFFSTLNAYLEEMQKKDFFLGKIQPFCEVTSGIAEENNIYKISFLLGFAGISVWFQVFYSFGGKISIMNFAAFRLIHAGLSVIFTKLFVLIINPVLPTLSNNRDFKIQGLYSNLAVSVSLLFTVVLFFISVFSQKRGRKLKEDLI